jgi:surfeit locus 1 family protein
MKRLTGPFLLLSLGIAIIAPALTGLGLWQLARLGERRALNAQIRARLELPLLTLTGAPITDAAALDYRRVTASGVYDFANEIVLKNRAYQGTPGVHVLTPLRIADGHAAVLVDRGWIPYEQSAPEARAVYHAPTGEVTVAGLARLPQTRASFLLPADPTPGPDLPRPDAWYWVNLEQIQAQLSYSVLPVFIELEAQPDKTQLPITGYEVDLTDGPHLSYAIQWFALAAIAVAGPLVYWRQQRRRLK